MAKLAEQESQSKENMKNAMLKHEQTFRHQVYELHRLYRIQKLLMKNIIENRGKTERWEVKNEDEDEEDEKESDFIEESEVELTLGPSNYSNQVGGGRRRRRKSCFSSSSSSSTTGSAQKSRSFYRHGELVGSSEMGFVGFLEDEMRLSQHHPNPWLCQPLTLNLTS
ncbi:hypothetical protein SDJN02_01975, partial [Cucurbita argyrosperma subsp. argyrosperma]